MNCDDMRRLLRLRFDEGIPAQGNLDPHIQQCPACARYARQLEAIDAGLKTLPRPAEVPELAARIKRRVTEESLAEQALQRLAMRWAVAAAVLAAGLGWLFPMAISYGEWWRRAENALAAFQWRDVLAPWRESVQNLLRGAESLFEGAARFPGLYLWLAIGGALLLLLAFNGIEARNIRRK